MKQIIIVVISQCVILSCIGMRSARVAPIPEGSAQRYLQRTNSLTPRHPSDLEDDIFEADLTARIAYWQRGMSVESALENTFACPLCGSAHAVGQACNLPGRVADLEEQIPPLPTSPPTIHRPSASTDAPDHYCRNALVCSGITVPIIVLLVLYGTYVLSA